MSHVAGVQAPVDNNPDAIAEVAIDAMAQLQACAAKHRYLVDYVSRLVGAGVVKEPEPAQER